MKTLRLFLIGCALGVVLFYAWVAAADAHMTNDFQRLAAFTPVAQSIYPPICGQAQVTIGTPPDAGADGEAYMDGSCRIIIRPGMDDARFCQVLVHEYGHLAGHQHEPTGIMDIHADADVPQCDVAVENSFSDYDRVLDLIDGDPSLIKGIRTNTPAYKRGVRWVVYTAQHDRWLVSGSGENMEADLTDEGVVAPKAPAGHRVV